MTPLELARVFRLSRSQSSAAHLIPCYRFCPRKSCSSPKSCSQPECRNACHHGGDEPKMLIGVFWRTRSLSATFCRRSSRRVAAWRRLAPCGAFFGKCAIGRQLVSQSANQRLLTTGSAVRRQTETQLVGARHSFGRHQNCSVLASGLGPKLCRGRRAQRLRLIRTCGWTVSFRVSESDPSNARDVGSCD